MDSNLLLLQNIHTLCSTAFDLIASFPPLRRRPLPLRIAKDAIYRMASKVRTSFLIHMSTKQEKTSGQ
jgi:hypothetical protein